MSKKPVYFYSENTPVPAEYDTSGGIFYFKPCVERILPIIEKEGISLDETIKTKIYKGEELGLEELQEFYKSFKDNEVICKSPFGVIFIEQIKDFVSQETKQLDSKIFFVQDNQVRNGIDYQKIDLGSSINLSADGIRAMQAPGRAGTLNRSINAANKFLFGKEYLESGGGDRIDMHATRFLVFDAMCSGVKFPEGFAERVLKTETDKLDPLNKDDLATLFETCRNYEKSNPTAALIFEIIRGGLKKGSAARESEMVLGLVKDLRDPFYEFIMSTEPAQIARIIDARARDDASREEVGDAGAEFSADEFAEKFDSMPKIFKEKLQKVGEAIVERDEARAAKYSVKNFIRIVYDALAACSFGKAKNINVALGDFAKDVSVKKRFEGMKAQLSYKAQHEVFNLSKEGGKPVGGRSF